MIATKRNLLNKLLSKISFRTLTKEFELRALTTVKLQQTALKLGDIFHVFGPRDFSLILQSLRPFRPDEQKAIKTDEASTQSAILITQGS